MLCGRCPNGKWFFIFFFGGGGSRCGVDPCILWDRSEVSAFCIDTYLFYWRKYVHSVWSPLLDISYKNPSLYVERTVFFFLPLPTPQGNVYKEKAKSRSEIGLEEEGEEEEKEIVIDHTPSSPSVL